MEQFDVAIIGAGPAGTYAAYEAAKKGLSTAVFEEHEKIGEPVHCGECLSALSCKRLELELPDEAISMRVKGIRLIFPGKRGVFLEEPGFTLEKHKFEQHLASLGKEKEAVYKLKHRVSGMKKDNGGWQISTTQGEYFAKIAIDASGVAGAASKFLSLNPEPKKVIGLQYEMSPIEHDGFIKFFLWPKSAPQGYLWIIPKSNDRANVGLVTHNSPLTRKCLEQFIDEYGFREKKKTKAFGGFIPASGPVKNTYSDGLMLIGDAAGFTSPMFEGGTSLAMASGKFAAQVATEAIAKGNTSKEMLSKYGSLWKAEFPNYSKLVKGKQSLYNFTDSELDKIASLIPQNLTNLSAFGKAKTGAKVLLNAPSLLLKGFVPAMTALGYSRAEFYGW